MVVRFEKEYLKELYTEGKSSDKKHRYQPEIVRKYKYCVDALAAAPSVETLFQARSLHYEVLKGDKAGISSIRVNIRYRIEFTVTDEGQEPVITVCNILELSNHYN
jgi:proteic killer suppression protein